MMNKLLWPLLAFVAGALLPIQGGLNNKFGKALESPVYASMISFCVGAAALIVYILITRQPVVISGFRTAPLYLWVAGALGAFYVTVIIYAFPRIGPALTFSLVVAGQMVIAVILEHYNILVAHSHPISFMRIIGIILILIGVVVIRKF
jgi:transporter family-2 protein